MSRVRHILCRSPGIEPAAHTTTSRGPDRSLTAPITWLWLGAASRSPPRSYPAVTAPSQAPARSVARCVYAGSARHPDSWVVNACNASRASATTDRPESLWLSRVATLMLTKRTVGSPKALIDAVVKSLPVSYTHLT